MVVLVCQPVFLTGESGSNPERGTGMEPHNLFHELPEDVQRDAAIRMQSTDFDAWKEPSHPEWNGFMEWTEQHNLFRSRALWRGWKGRPQTMQTTHQTAQTAQTPELKRAALIFESGNL